MRNTLLTLIALGFVGVSNPLLSAQKTTTTNVTATVYDCSGSCTGTNQLLMRSDDYNGSGSAAYATTSNKGNTGNVQSYIDTDGTWALYLSGQSLRTLWITPNDPVGATQPSTTVPIPVPGFYSHNVQAHSGCYDATNNLVPFPNLLNGSNNCRVGAEFYYSGLVYKLVMGPDLPWGGPTTGLASVVCNKLSGNQCIDWTIAPNTAAANPNVANLYYYNASIKNPGWVFVGQYYNTFLVHLTNP
jgi:hypothetical protein